MNLYAISSYKEVVIYIDPLLGCQMYDEGHPIEYESENEAENEGYYYIIGKLVFQENPGTDLIHIMPNYKNNYTDRLNIKMKVYAFEKNDIISIHGWLR